jgi:hypothetical protein
MSSTKTQNKNHASSFLKKEMQRVIAISALEKVYSINTMSLQNIQRKMHKLYHCIGSDVNHTSFVELCLEGKMQFGH